MKHLFQTPGLDNCAETSVENSAERRKQTSSAVGSISVTDTLADLPAWDAPPGSQTVSVSRAISTARISHRQSSAVVARKTIAFLKKAAFHVFYFAGPNNDILTSEKVVSHKNRSHRFIAKKTRSRLLNTKLLQRAITVRKDLAAWRFGIADSYWNEN